MIEQPIYPARLPPHSSSQGHVALMLYYLVYSTRFPTLKMYDMLHNKKNQHPVKKQNSGFSCDST